MDAFADARRKAENPGKQYLVASEAEKRNLPNLISYIYSQRFPINNVDFIVVGGVCAVLQGTPIATFDIDIVHSREPDNIERLMKALEELDTIYRDPLGRVIKPDETNLSSPGHHLLMTKAGPLDLLGELAPGKGHDELVQNVIT